MTASRSDLLLCGVCASTTTTSPSHRLQVPTTIHHTQCSWRLRLRLYPSTRSRTSFRRMPTTQQQCDQEAERLTGMSVHTAPVQGGNSYTVLSNDETVVVQFRAGDSALDISLLECIEQAYGGFAPRHQFVGNMGELHVYTMSNVGGISMYIAREELFQNNFYLLRQTVSDFARYVATNAPSPDVKETAQLTLPTQIFRLGME